MEVSRFVLVLRFVEVDLVTVPVLFDLLEFPTLVEDWRLVLLLRFTVELLPEPTVPSPEDLREVPAGFADCDLFVTVVEDLRDPVVALSPVCLVEDDPVTADLLPLLSPEDDTASLLGLSGLVFAYNASPSLLDSGLE